MFIFYSVKKYEIGQNVFFNFCVDEKGNGIGMAISGQSENIHDRQYAYEAEAIEIVECNNNGCYVKRACIGNRLE